MERETSSGPALVLFPGALGDMICLEPALRLLSTQGPVELRARGAAAEVARLFPCRPAVAPLDCREIDAFFAERDAEAEEGMTRFSGYRRALSFTGFRDERFRARFGRLPESEVFPFPGPHGEEHAIDEMIRAVAGGRLSGDAMPRVGVAAGARGRRPAVGSRLIFHPGSGGGEKRAPPEVFGAVVENFRARTGGEVLAILGPAEQGEDRIWRQFADRLERPVGVEALAAMLAGADCYLGNDAGPTHLCAAMGIPTVAIFVSSSARRFGPRGRSVRIVDVQTVSGRLESAVWEALAEGLP